MKMPDRKNIFNILLIVAIAALMVSQFLLLQNNNRLKNEAKQIKQEKPAIQLPEAINLAQALPDSLFAANNSRMIVLRIMNSDCKDCRDSLFSGARQLAGKLGKENICIIAGNYREEDFFMYKRLYRYDFDHFIHMPNRLTPIDSTGLSYYFVLNKRAPAEACFVFYPEIENRRSIQNYFNNLNFLIK